MSIECCHEWVWWGEHVKGVDCDYCIKCWDARPRTHIGDVDWVKLCREMLKHSDLTKRRLHQ